MVPSAAVALDATVEVVGDSEDAASRARSSCALADLRKRIRELLRVLEALGVQRRVITRLGQSFERMNGAMLTDALGNALDLSVERKLALLRAVDVDERVHLLLEYTQHGTGTADERVRP